MRCYTYMIAFSPVSTPEAVHNISQSIQRASRSQQSKHPHPHSTSIPRRIHAVSQMTSDPEKSAIGLRANESERVQSSAKSTKQEKKYSRSTKSHIRSHVYSSGVHHTEPVRKTTPSRSDTSHRTDRQSKKATKSPQIKTVMGADTHVSGRGSVHAMTSPSLSVKALSTRSPQITPTHPRLLDTMPAAHDILAAQVQYYIHVQCYVH